jgi:hypothetical protein
MISPLLAALPVLLWFANTSAHAGGCISEGADPCTCKCDKTVSIRAESKALGTCRVQEQKENICSLLWNEGPNAVSKRAEQMGESLNQGSLDFSGSALIDQVVWNDFSQIQRPQISQTTGRELDYEGAAVALLNMRPPDEYTVGQLHPSLSILLTSHLQIIELRSISQDELEYDIHGLIWSDTAAILQGMQSRQPVMLSMLGMKSGRQYDLVLSYGCFSATSDLVSFMIKTPFAEASAGRCSFE